MELSTAVALRSSGATASPGESHIGMYLAPQTSDMCCFSATMSSNLPALDWVNPISSGGQGTWTWPFPEPQTHAPYSEARAYGPDDLVCMRLTPVSGLERRVGTTWAQRQVYPPENSISTAPRGNPNKVQAAHSQAGCCLRPLHTGPHKEKNLVGSVGCRGSVFLCPMSH